MRNGNQGVIEMTYIEKFWRDATAADVARALAGEVVEARFRDSEIHVWTSVRRLIGARAVDVPEIALRWLDCASGWRYCQAYAPPQWFVDKPEPGEGYRLLGKEPDEAKHRDDEIFREGRWDSVGFDDGKQREGFWYRRRIEQLLPEHRWLILGDRLQSGDLCFNKGVVVEVEHNYWGDKVVISEAFMRRIDQPKPEPKHYVLQVGDTAETGNGFSLIVTEHGVEVT